MKIAVLGTGGVGQALATRLAELGHQVVVGTREVASAVARTQPTGYGTPFGIWHAEHPGIPVATFAEAAAGADLIINATGGNASLDALAAVGAEHLAGKALLDLANPLDFSGGGLPTLFVKDTDSLAEQLQRAYPAARVVKALNTMNASVMTQPQRLAGGDHTVFVCGDDAAAKQVVVELLREFGWQDILDLGPLSCARGAEMLLPIWLRLTNSLGTTDFNFKIVR